MAKPGPADGRLTRRRVQKPFKVSSSVRQAPPTSSLPLKDQCRKSMYAILMHNGSQTVGTRSHYHGIIFIPLWTVRHSAQCSCSGLHMSSFASL